MWSFNVSRKLLLVLNNSVKPTTINKPNLFQCLNSFSVAKNYASQPAKAAPRIKKIQPPPSFSVPKKKNEIDGLAILLLCIPVSTFALGTWQVKRKKWKEDLIAELRHKTQLPVIDLPTNEEDLDSFDYRRVLVKGRFDHSNEIYIGPRSCFVEGESSSGGKLISSGTSNSGYYVVTPFVLSETNERILVNRGWVPFSHKDPRKRPEGQVEGTVELEGYLRKSEPRQPFVPPDKPNIGVFMTRNVEKIAEVLKTKPIFIDATAESTVPGGPIGGQTRVTMRNEHLSYIITWYSLSAATGVMWYMKYLR